MKKTDVVPNACMQQREGEESLLFKKCSNKRDMPEITRTHLTGVGKNRYGVWKRRPFWVFVVVIILIVIIVVGYWWWLTNTTCSRRGSHSLFVADFDSDAIGSTPAPSTSLHYGPPGASLNIQGESGTIVVVDSMALGSRALRITRSAPSMTEVEAVVGDIGDMPYTSGVVFIEFRAHGEIISEPMIAGMAISVHSAEGDVALALKLYNGSYHLQEGGSYVRIDGSYNPDTAHFVYIELNMDTGKYTICIDEEVVVATKEFLGNFANLHALKFWVAPTITEAFPTAYVVDEIRMTK